MTQIVGTTVKQTSSITQVVGITETERERQINFADSLSIGTTGTQIKGADN